MRQTWSRLTFLHWPYDPELIRPHIPTALELDTFDGAAWLGLVPFEIYGTPGLPYFPETNLRTYVIGPDGSPAVWFFSLEAASLFAVLGARVGYHLPYFWSSMRVTSENGVIRYQSRRRWPHETEAMTDFRVQPGQPYDLDEITERDHFLTARFRLYSMARGRLHSARIAHPPWPLTRANLIEIRQTLIQKAGLSSPIGAPLVHYAPELAVEIGPLI